MSVSAPSPQEFRELVRSQTDIVGLIAESIALQPRHGGRQYVGLCCFHDDRNPSLNVYPDRQTFRCWSCQTGGDVFTFVMQHDAVTFPEALEILAKRANIPIPQKLGGRPEGEEINKARILEALQWAEREFHVALVSAPEAEPARRYLLDRGFSLESIKKYQLGFHPDNWNWLEQRANGKFSPKVLLDSKLIDQKNGRTFDNYVNRVLFPIHNERGQAVSFGGRILPGSDHPAKYWNGPESPVFHKSRTLYALDFARDEIRQSKSVVVVEGYTDCLACHMAGMTNVVATLGTALTDQHVTALKRFARQVVLVFDGDEAGQRAASKSVERFLAQDVDLRILTLPEGQDPADYLKAHSVDDLRKLVDSAPEAWNFQYRYLKTEFGIETVDGRQRVLEGMVNLFAEVPSLQGSLRESVLVANVAHRLSLSEASVQAALKDARDSKRNFGRRMNDAVEPRPFTEGAARIIHRRLNKNERVEYDLLESLLAAPQHFHYYEDVLFEHPFRNTVLAHIWEQCVAECMENDVLTFSGLMSRVQDPDLTNLLVWIDEQATAKGIAEKIDKSVEQTPTDGGDCPPYLVRALENLKWRSEEESHQVTAARLSQTEEDAAIEEENALLMQAAAFHQQRDIRNATG
ncbi:MAG: DNA primase [Planctomycetaceae bacterium]|nr:DNA primase [Planctomycetaceae bacterium]